MTIYQFTVVIEPDEEAFHAYVPTLPGCHTFGSTIDEARANIAEAIELHILNEHYQHQPERYLAVPQYSAVQAMGG